METLALKPHLLARQAHAASCVRSSGTLRPASVSIAFLRRRTVVPRNRITACTAAAEVEEVQQVAVEEPTIPAQSTETPRQESNGGTRRRDANQNKRKKLPVKYKLEDLVIGQEVEGVVGSIMDFGAFVDIGLGSKDALLHISQLSDGFVKDVKDVVAQGDIIKARILNVELSLGKVGLTMRTEQKRENRAEGDAPQLRYGQRSESNAQQGEGQGDGGRLYGQRDGQRSMRIPAGEGAPMQARARRAPRERKEIKYPAVGEEITGKVEGVQNFGVFVKVSEDVSGMLHQAEVATPDSREPNMRAMFNVGDDIKVRVLRVDAKARKVDLTQRSEEDRALDKKLAEEGARSVKVSGLNTLGAALARAGISKKDYEDISKAPEEDSADAPAAEVPSAAAPSAPEPETLPVEEEPAAAPSPVAALQEAAAVPGPTPEPEVPEVLAAQESAPPAPEATSAPTGGEAAPVIETPEPEPEPVLSATEAAPEPKDLPVPTPEAVAASSEADAAVAAPEPEAAAVPEQAPAPALEEPKEEPVTEAFPAAEAATEAASATIGDQAAPEPAVEPASSASEPVEAAPNASTAADSAPAPFKVDAKSAKALRDQTGAGMMDAKKALMETQGDVAKAVEWLRKKGLSSADKKSGRVASEGVIASYIHAGSRLGVLVELNCETDFVARGDKFKELVNDMAMQIAASGDISVVSVEDVPADIKQKEFDIEMGKEDIQSKPEAIRPKIVEGRVAKTLKTMALLEQPFIKDTNKDVASVVKEAVAALGENIQIRRFEKFVLGEGIEKKTNDLAKEVEAQTKAFEEAAAKKAASAPESPAPTQEAAAEPAQVKIDAKAVKELRQASGAGMMDAKKALQQCGGDVDKAMDYLRKKGLASADKKSGRLASEGAIGAYIHAGSRLGVLVEVNCETDFVARGDQFKELVNDIAMQIAASPTVDIVSIDEAPQEELERERALEMQKEDIQSKPENIRGKIVDGRVQKIFKERALLEQPFIKDTSKTVAEHIKAQVATIGENIQVRQFARFVLGEGIEKKQEDFAAEIAAATGQA